MKVFVTGGTGLIGRHLVAGLIARKDEVFCVTRHEARARSLLPVGVHIIEEDPTRGGSWQDVLAGCDAVVNLAGEPIAEGRWTGSRKKVLRRSRLAVTRNVGEAIARREDATILISSSATGYYGDAGAAALPENAESGAGFLARLAQEWESTALEAESATTRVVLLRIGVVLAADGGALPKLTRPFRFGLGGPLGSGRQYFPWIHIDDLVRVIFFALDTPDLSGPVNAVAPDPPTQGSFARSLGSAVSRPALVPAPVFLLRSMLGEKGELLLNSQRAVPKALRARSFHFDYEDLELALGDLLS